MTVFLKINRKVNGWFQIIERWCIFKNFFPVVFQKGGMPRLLPWPEFVPSASPLSGAQRVDTCYFCLPSIHFSPLVTAFWFFFEELSLTSSLWLQGWEHDPGLAEGKLHHLATEMILRRAGDPGVYIRSGNFGDITVNVALSARMLSGKNVSLEVVGASALPHWDAGAWQWVSTE